MPLWCCDVGLAIGAARSGTTVHCKLHCFRNRNARRVWRAAEILYDKSDLVMLRVNLNRPRCEKMNKVFVVFLFLPWLLILFALLYDSTRFATINLKVSVLFELFIVDFVTLLYYSHVIPGSTKVTIVSPYFAMFI